MKLTPAAGRLLMEAIDRAEERRAHRDAVILRAALHADVKQWSETLDMIKPKG